MWEVKKKQVYRTTRGAHEARIALAKLKDGYKYHVVLYKNGKKQKKLITAQEEKERCYSWMIERVKINKPKPLFGSIPSCVLDIPKTTYPLNWELPSNLESGFLYRLQPMDFALVVQYAKENPDCRVVVQDGRGIHVHKGEHMRKLSIKDMRGY